MICAKYVFGTSAIMKPYNDFMLLQQIYNFEYINKDIEKMIEAL